MLTFLKVIPSIKLEKETRKVFQKIQEFPREEIIILDDSSEESLSYSTPSSLKLFSLRGVSLIDSVKKWCALIDSV